MRIQLVLLALIAVACTGQTQEAVSTTRPLTTSSAPTTTTTQAPTTSAASTTTTTQPTTTTEPALPELQGLSLEPVAEGLPFPVAVTSPPGDERLFIATKDGRIWIVDGQLGDEPFLDLREPVRNDEEQGLLGLAFHPGYSSNGRFFVHYTALNGATVVSEFLVSDDPAVADPASERVVLTEPQPAENHNGGMIQFGPDGYLYIGLGDGGKADDRFGNGQNPGTILGTILRIDVDERDLDSDGTDEVEFSIPVDNPFVDGGVTGDLVGDPAVWAYGLRNPWRFWIDDGLIYIGDVGQDAFEEISVAPVEPVAYNFGWPITEALHCFSPRSGCATDGLVLPLIEVSHGDAGTCSITGGVTYRGDAIPELDGHYFYSDFCGGYLRSFVAAGGVATEQTDWTDQVGRVPQVSSFGVDRDGEVYVVSATGVVYRIVPER